MKGYVKGTITNCRSPKIWIVLNKEMPLRQIQTCDYNENILMDDIQDTLPKKQYLGILNILRWMNLRSMCKKDFLAFL